jgi:hypothetical protein
MMDSMLYLIHTCRNHSVEKYCTTLPLNRMLIKLVIFVNKFPNLMPACLLPANILNMMLTRTYECNGEEVNNLENFIMRNLMTCAVTEDHCGYQIKVK